MYDFHMHTIFSDDGSYAPEEMIEAAIAKGLDAIAITDHLDPYFPDTDMPFLIDLDAYEVALPKFVDTYKDSIDISMGIELGLQVGPAITVCHETIRRFPYDFIIGSIHAAKGECIHLPVFCEGKSLEQIIEDYYTDMRDCILAYKDYDVLGHINVIDRYAGGYAPASMYMPYVDEILRLAVADGKGIEVNTSSHRYGLERETPTQDIVDRYVELGGEIITTGSDAHRPQDVGADLEKGEQMILASGLSYVATYKGRKPEFHKIP
jgi:histidinol-phosphatase (PHP family)